MSSSPRRPLPPVEQVRPGLWSIPVPIPNNPLRYVLVYALDTDRGPYLIDAGWNTDESYDSLRTGLERMGTTTRAVQGVLVSHIHPDHFGLAGRIQQESGAWVGMHPADIELIQGRYVEPGPLLRAVWDTLQMAGAPPDEMEALQQASMPVLPLVGATDPDVVMEDGFLPDVPGWDLRAIWTPGHTPGHLCFYDERNHLLFSGDHVLPRITPNVSLLDEDDIDPLGDFLQSLRKVGSYEAEEVLPAHEHRFVGLRERADELVSHHEDRFAQVERIVADGSCTAWQVAAHMEWSRPWERISGFMRRMALFEALAHLRALEVRGRLVVTDQNPRRWGPTT
ncbi:MAG: MBL fold metallo-hydrolase [Nitriliruptorales bacterium]|nr:MBL fold metallo-hydrolase [Nitriliruptorales bacterium]